MLEFQQGGATEYTDPPLVSETQAGSYAPPAVYPCPSSVSKLSPSRSSDLTSDFRCSPQLQGERRKSKVHIQPNTQEKIIVCYSAWSSHVNNYFAGNDFNYAISSYLFLHKTVVAADDVWLHCTTNTTVRPSIRHIHKHSQNIGLPELYRDGKNTVHEGLH